MDPQPLNLTDELKQRFLSLPPVVQNAIISADIEKNLRSLEGTQQLHIDQWEKLENEVMLTLLGVQAIENLEQNIAVEVGVPSEIASALATNINNLVFEPIREELERQLEHPDAQAKEVSGVEAMRDQALANTPAEPTAPAVQPATPPSPMPEVKVARPTDSTSYKPGETSAQRAAVHEDPYREPPV